MAKKKEDDKAEETPAPEGVPVVPEEFDEPVEPTYTHLAADDAEDK
jgi:hypothetical protein